MTAQELAALVEPLAQAEPGLRPKRRYHPLGPEHQLMFQPSIDGAHFGWTHTGASGFPNWKYEEPNTAATHWLASLTEWAVRNGYMIDRFGLCQPDEHEDNNVLVYFPDNRPFFQRVADSVREVLIQQGKLLAESKIK